MLLSLVLTCFGFSFALSLPSIPGGSSLIDNASLGLVGTPPAFASYISYRSTPINNVSFAESIFDTVTSLAKENIHARIPAREYTQPQHPDCAIEVYPPGTQTIELRWVLWGLLYGLAEMLTRHGSVVEADLDLALNGRLIGRLQFRNRAQTANNIATGGMIEGNSTEANTRLATLNATNNVQYRYRFIEPDPHAWLGQPKIYSALVNAAVFVAEENDWDPQVSESYFMSSINMKVQVQPPDVPRTRAPYNTKRDTITSLRAIQVHMKIFNAWRPLWVETRRDGFWISTIVVGYQHRPAASTGNTNGGLRSSTNTSELDTALSASESSNSVAVM